MLLLHILASSFVIALSGAMMPGPLLTVTVVQTAKRGFIASVLLVLGHSILELALIIGLVFGLGSILQLRSVSGLVVVLGGFMLLWMGWGMVRDAYRGTLDLELSANTAGDCANLSERGDAKIMLAGAAISISNPYWLVWWATIGLTALTLLGHAGHNAVLAVGAFYLGHIMGDALWYLAVGLAVVTGQRLLKASVYRGIIGICGAFLVFLGGSFLYLVVTGKLWEIKMVLDVSKHFG